MYLGGNLNKFSILKNSCATVALRAWNGAVGTRQGQPTAYYLEPSGTGIYALIDAPKTVRDAIRDGLPGYYLNNASEVQEPDASFTDDTGEVYVSAPEKVSPVTYTYGEGSIRIDETRTSMASLVNQAKSEKQVYYNKESQEILVDVEAETDGSDGTTTVNEVRFTINGETVSLDGNDPPEKGIWLCLAASGSCYVTDKAGVPLPSVYAEGTVRFFLSDLPGTFKLNSSDDHQNILRTTIVNEEKAGADTEVYFMKEGTKVSVDGQAALAGGTKFYVRASLGEGEAKYLVSSLTLNGESLLDSYDPEKGIYTGTMPETYAELKVVYDTALVRPTDNAIGETIGWIQVPVGSRIDVTEQAALQFENKTADSDRLRWKIAPNGEDEGVVALSADGKTITAEKAGSAGVIAFARDNPNISCPFMVEVYDAEADMVCVNYDADTGENTVLTAVSGEDRRAVLYSGYQVPKGYELLVFPPFGRDTVVSSVTCNGKSVPYGTTIIADRDMTIHAAVREARITGMPAAVKLEARGDTHQLGARLQYSGILAQFLPVYDPVLHYESSDPRVSVDEKGRITVTGDVPEEGFSAIITAAAHANPTITATCKVTVGDYSGSRIVGRLTIHARSISSREMTPHASLTFMPYEEVEIPVSYYHYHKPNWKYERLLLDYEKHPEKYSSDPALYCEDLTLQDRESYFDTATKGPESDPETIALRKGECISISTYSFDENNIITVMGSLLPILSEYPPAADLLVKLAMASATGSLDGNEIQIFDDLAATILYLYQGYQETGISPATGKTEGGTEADREIFNQFRRNDSQMPNNFYSVDITEEQLARLTAGISDPETNYYSLFNSNCSSTAVRFWNAALSDIPELQLKADYTGFAVDPESLYVELKLLSLKRGLPGSGGTDFYPRWDVSDAETWDRKWPFDGALTITANDREITQGEALPTWTEDSYTVNRKDLYSKDELSSVSVSYRQNGEEVSPTRPGVYDIVPTGPVIRDENGRDVTESYNIEYVPGKLTVKAGASPGSGGNSRTEPVSDEDCPRDDTCPISAFADSAPDAWYHDGVHWALENEIMKGMTESTFEPGTSTSRAMIVTMLWRMEGEPEADSFGFTDVEAGSWYGPAVDWAASEEIVKGYGEGRIFGPYDTLTREQLAAILFRYNELKAGSDVILSKAKDLTPDSGLKTLDSQYTDADRISDWAVEALQWAVGAGIITGTTETTLEPQGDATRAQVATMLMRYCTGR